MSRNMHNFNVGEKIVITQPIGIFYPNNIGEIEAVHSDGIHLIVNCPGVGRDLVPFHSIASHNGILPSRQSTTVTLPSTQTIRSGYFSPVFFTGQPKKKRTKPKPKLTLESVVMSENKRNQIRSAISQIDNNKIIFDDWGFSEVFEKGTAVTLLFYGIPGTGKTLTAQAIANELNADLKIYGTAEIQSSEPGGAERAMKEIFKKAKDFFNDNKKTQVILFDECDSLLVDRNEVGSILGAQINTLLSEIERHEGVILFTTNRLGKLDPALERRISAKIEFEFPNETQRAEIWKRLIPKKAPIDTDVNFANLAEYTLAGGNIKNAVLNAVRTAAYEKSSKIQAKHFTQAIEHELEALRAFIDAYEGAPHHRVGRTTDFAQTEGKIEMKEKLEMKKGAASFLDALKN